MKVSERISVKNLNSFGVEVRAARYVEWERVEEFAEIPFDGRWLALGGGNNILFTGDFDGTLIKSAARNIEITDETPKQTTVRAEAGVDWDDFVMWSIRQNLWGAENLSGIPGTVGAAPIQNIGAYGAEAKDIIRSVECFSVYSRNIITFSTEHCDFDYRDSVFKRRLKGQTIVTAVNFTLSKIPRPNLGYAALAQKTGTNKQEPSLEEIRTAILDIRTGKLPDPHVVGNAGSFFKNPIVDTALAREMVKKHPDMPLYPCTETGKTKLAAGWLIDKAGWRGRQTGNVGVHPEQALVIVNLGGATGREIAAFAQQLQADVYKKFGVGLDPEINFV